MHKKVIKLISIGSISLSLILCTVGCDNGIDTESYEYKCGESSVYEKYVETNYEDKTTNKIGNSCANVFILYSTATKFNRDFRYKTDDKVIDVNVKYGDDSFSEYRRGYLDELIKLVDKDYNEGLIKAYTRQLGDDAEYYEYELVLLDEKYGEEYKSLMFDLFDCLTEIRDMDNGQMIDENSKVFDTLFELKDKYYSLDVKIMHDLDYIE